MGTPRVVTDDALQLRPHEQVVLTEALRRFEANEADRDPNAARIADRLREDIRKGRSLRGIAEIPA